MTHDHRELIEVEGVEIYHGDLQLTCAISARVSPGGESLEDHDLTITRARVTLGGILFEVDIGTWPNHVSEEERVRFRAMLEALREAAGEVLEDAANDINEALWRARESAWENARADYWESLREERYGP